MIGLSAAARGAIAECLAHGGADTSTTSSATAPRRGDGAKHQRSTTKVSHTAIAARMATAAAAQSPSIKAQREALPAFQHRASVLQTIRTHRLTIINGATGCGKSTQLPQLLLEDAVEQQLEEACIIVAQPRRLAATALADRVSVELSDTLGGLCGYRIRGESQVGPSTALTYVTTGVLLRLLESDPLLASVTHVVVDEVHERSVETDLLLLVLRRALRAGTAARVVLMSATLDTDAFARYFGAGGAGGAGAAVEGGGGGEGGGGAGGPCGAVGVCEVPGRSFPVAEHFLERAVADAVAGGGFTCAPTSEWAREVPLPDAPTMGASGKAAADAASAAEAAAAARAKADADGTAASRTVAANLEERALKLQNAAAASAASKAIGGVATEALRAEGAAATVAAHGAAAAAALRNMDLSVVNEDLVEALAMRHHDQYYGGGHGGGHGGGDGSTGGATAHGSVLVFLPGVAEIDRLARRLEARRAESLHVVRLHSQLTSAEQRAAFAPAPRRGLTKVVLSTDLAETSVTIPDVTLVLDGGLHRLLACDERASHAPHLKTARVSLASAKQRAGRAGRVRAGACYHLFCEAEATSGAMAAAPTAEIRRVPLEAPLLQLRALLHHDDDEEAAPSTPAATVAVPAATPPIKSADLLAEAIEPPDAAAVARAVAALVQMGAIEVGAGGGERLTKLGRRLCGLGVAPRLGKALVCADVLGCVPAAALVVASIETPSEVFGRGAASGAAKRALDASSCHLAALRAHSEWRRQRGAARRDMCERLGVSDAAMRDMDSLARRLEALVASSRDGGGAPGGADGGGANGGVDDASAAALAKACLLCGSSASLMRVSAPEGRKPMELLWRVGKSDVALRPHEGSVLGAEAAAAAEAPRRGGGGGKGGGKGNTRGEGGAEPTRWCVSLQLLRSSRGLAALDATLVSPLAALLFGPTTLPEATEAVQAAAASSDGGGGEEASAEAPVATVSTSAVQWDVAGASVALRASDAVALRSLRAHFDAIVIGGGGGGTDALRRAVGELIVPGMDVPWWGLPEGWEYCPDAAGKPLYRSTVDPATAVRTKPSETAAQHAARAEAGRGSLAAANAEHARKKREQAEKAAALADEEARAAAVRRAAMSEEERAALAEAERSAQRAAAAKVAEAEAARVARAHEEAEAHKRATKALASNAEANEAKARAAAGVSGGLRGGVAQLLAELELDKYAAAFAAAGVDDARLAEIAEAIDLDMADGDGGGEDEDEGGERAGAAAVEALIAAVGVKGGSAVKLRRRLLDPRGSKGGAPGGKGRGGGAGKGGGGRPGGGSREGRGGGGKGSSTGGRGAAAGRAGGGGAGRGRR